MPKFQARAVHCCARVLTKRTHGGWFEAWLRETSQKVPRKKKKKSIWLKQFQCHQASLRSQTEAASTPSFAPAPEGRATGRNTSRQTCVKEARVQQLSQVWIFRQFVQVKEGRRHRVGRSTINEARRFA